MSVVFDISRLMSRAEFETPTGIDRFELNYANWALRQFPSNLRFVAGGPLGHRNLPRGFAESFIAETAEKWTSRNNSDDQTTHLKAIIAEIETGAVRKSISSSSRAPTKRAFQHAWKSLPALLWSSLSVPSSSLFIHVSHAGLHKQAAYDWLARRDCSPLFYVHDIIPLLRPEFCRSGEANRHKARIQAILRLHRLVLCNSQATARTLDELAEDSGLPQPCTAVLPPGLETCFSQFDPASGVRTKQPYFVCLGTIEPRKNHALLLNIWRQLVELYGERAPKLVIAGRRGWDNSHVFSVLDDPAAFRGTVIEAPGLNDRSLAQLLAGASALLAPSYIEGYGMPVAEALALGTPVIASNIRAHREVSRGRAVLLDTLDGLGWLDAINAHTKRLKRKEPGEQKHWTWDDHFDALHRILVSARLSAATQKRPATLIPISRRTELLVRA